MSQRLLILLCLVFTTGFACAAQTESSQTDTLSGGCIPVRSLEEDRIAFQAGEHLEFALKYDWGLIHTTVGSASIDLDTVSFNGTKAFYMKAFGRTSKMFDRVFKVREDFNTWFSVEGLRPLKFTRDTYEGRYRATNCFYYDWNAPERHIKADVFTSSSGKRYVELPLTECTADLPALFYYARNVDFDSVEPGKRYPMTFAIDDDVYNVYFILFGRETIEVEGVGKVKTIKFAAKLLEGEVFTGEEDMLIWVSDDENRLPVYFEAPLLVGLATGRITSYTGLKYPFTALVEAAVPKQTKKK
jgi:hypothetical protein